MYTSERICKKYTNWMVDNSTIITNASPYYMIHSIYIYKSILCSNMHMKWTFTVAGKLEKEQIFLYTVL